MANRNMPFAAQAIDQQALSTDVSRLSSEAKHAEP